MSAVRRQESGSRACARCLRRSWLLSAVATPLEYYSRGGRLLELLALDENDLIEAVGGRRRTDLRSEYDAWRPHEPSAGDVQALCRHSDGYPVRLNGRAAPHMLNIAGGAQRLSELAAGSVVAILGSARASDYGVEIAKGLARGLAACGVTVAGGLLDGISAAAHAGALEVHGPTIAVPGGGLSVPCAARHRWLFERIKSTGCAVSELPCDSPMRRWGAQAGERIAVELAELVVVVEAERAERGMAGACLALALGRRVAAVPGRVTSPLSDEPNELLMGGACLVRGPDDVLDLLARTTGAGQRMGRVKDVHAGLEPALRRILRLVATGSDTPEKLMRSGEEEACAVLPALGELELMGLLGRGDGGRYVPRPTAPSRAQTAER